MSNLINRLKKLRTELAFGCDEEAASMVGEAVLALESAHGALQGFLTAYGSQESNTAGLDAAADKARSLLASSVPRQERQGGAS